MAVKIAACRFDGRLREAPVLDDADLLPPAAKKERLLPTDETLRLRHHHFAEPVAATDCLERIVSAKGQYMYSDKGIQYLDMRNNVHHVGHCHPKVVEAGVKQMTLLNTNSRFLHDEIVKLARNLSSTLPGKLDCFFFTNSGSEANDLALQITEQVTGHSDMIAINGAYHGHLKSLRAISNHPMSNVKGQRKPDYAHIVSLPDIYRGQYKDPVTAGELYADEVKHIIEECHQQGKKIAAFICETILCCGGVVVLPDGYLKHVYDSIHAAGGLCIADEVQTGFGRVGSHFWAFELQGVIPDIVTMGKPMGNGHPVAAVVTTREIADKFAATGIEYFNTFGGNPVSMAIACSVLEVIKEEKLQENALTVGTYLLKQLRQLQSGHDCIGDVRGVGLMIGVEIVKSKATREPDKDKAKAIITRLTKEYQILGLYDGVDGNVLKIKPPACVTVENMDYFVCSLDAILSTM